MSASLGWLVVMTQFTVTALLGVLAAVFFHSGEQSGAWGFVWASFFWGIVTGSEFVFLLRGGRWVRFSPRKPNPPSRAHPASDPWQ